MPTDGCGPEWLAFSPLATPAHVRPSEARAAALERHVRQEFHVVVEGLDLEVRELLLADSLDRQRHVLEALIALGGGDDDLVEFSDVCLLCLCDALCPRAAHPRTGSARFTASAREEISRISRRLLRVM
jgi:hypothetical protein